MTITIITSYIGLDSKFMGKSSVIYNATILNPCLLNELNFLSPSSAGQNVTFPSGVPFIEVDLEMTQNISEVALLTDLCGSPEFSFEETSGLF